jgi:1-aminocyclopropane-1-carboxylate deaminase/D-cysteine desulfhydrase-like pyridoxal-dependent ACC family enzyme
VAVIPLAQIERQIRLLPRFSLLAGETPLHELPHLSRRLHRRIFVKRDDLTGLAFGGNKVRQAEFFVGEALARGADTLVAGGSFAQSNHARVLAAAARAAGLEPVILLRPGTGRAAADMRGNALVTRLLAAEVRVLEELRDAPAGDRQAEVEFRRQVFETVADDLRARGRRPHVVLGSSTGLGVIGYVGASAELYRQRQRQEISFSKIFVTSLGATHAGLELGARLLGESHEVVAFAYQPAEAERAERTVHELVEAGARQLGVEPPAVRSVRTDVDEAGRRYAASTPRSRRALRLAAASDGLVLDPTYTAKGFAGMLRWIEEGRVDEGEAVLFVHTGGLPALFARSWRELSRP